MEMYGNQPMKNINENVPDSCRPIFFDKLSNCQKTSSPTIISAQNKTWYLQNQITSSPSDS
jgi:hypothetical protein